MTLKHLHTSNILSPARGRHIIYLYDLLRELVARDIKLRYKGSILGVAWSLLNPLSQLLVFSFIFEYVLPLNIANYSSFLFTGLLAWSWFQAALFAAATVIVDGRSLIRRPGFPAAILPIVSVATNLVHFLLALPVLLAFLLLSGIPLKASVLLLPALIALQAAFTVGLAYFVATFHVTFRDTQHLIGVFLLLFFYLTPIFYDATFVPEQFQSLYHLNPLLHLLDAYRAVLLRGEMPEPEPLLVLACLSTVLLFLGYRVFLRASYRFVEEL